MIKQECIGIPSLPKQDAKSLDIACRDKWERFFRTSASSLVKRNIVCVPEFGLDSKKESTNEKETNRDRPKSAPYPRLKNSKRTSNCQFTDKLEKPKNGPSGALGPASASPWRAKRGTLPKLSTFLSQLKGGPLEKQILEKSLAVPKKLKGGPLVSLGMACYAGKQEKLFWFSSLGQMVQ